MKNLFAYILGASVLFLAGCATENEIYVAPAPVEASFQWKNLSIDESNDTQWCLSRSNSWVAFTDYDNKSQCVLSWEGGMSNGTKTNASVSLSDNGSEPTVYQISGLNLDSDGVNCTLTFKTDDGTQGRISFPL